MKKLISILILTILLVSTPVNSADVFLTSDNIYNPEIDLDLLESIKIFLENKDNLVVNIDPDAPGPGEGTRVMLTSEDIRVLLAAACAGNFYEIAKYSTSTEAQIIYVNIGDFDIDTEDSLRRAWDDNYSNELFAGIDKPGQFLRDAGISTIQPLQSFPNAGNDGILVHNNDEANEFIASEIINDKNSYNSENKVLNEELLNYHKISPKIMATGSSELLKSENIDSDSRYNSFSPDQLLYLISTYFGSQGIDNPQEYEGPNSPLSYSLFAKSSYSIWEYMEMGAIVKEHMDETGQAPNYIIYKGAVISYYDLLYNFALITENHTDMYNMDFDRSYEFNKYNESILVDIFPVILIMFGILIAYLIIRKIRNF